MLVVASRIVEEHLRHDGKKPKRKPQPSRGRPSNKKYVS
jgi:hypothetical protein